MALNAGLEDPIWPEMTLFGQKMPLFGTSRQDRTFLAIFGTFWPDPAILEKRVPDLKTWLNVAQILAKPSLSGQGVPSEAILPLFPMIFWDIWVSF